jgi:hypothetical protein
VNPPLPTTCNATTRERARLYICELLLHHEDDHRDGDHRWSDDVPAALTLRRL